MEVMSYQELATTGSTLMTWRYCEVHTLSFGRRFFELVSVPKIEKKELHRFGGPLRSALE